MNDTPPNLQKLRAELEPWLADVDGVVGTGIGLSENGQQVVKVYTSVPTKDLSLSEPLPAGVELEFVGEIDAQQKP